MKYKTGELYQIEDASIELAIKWPIWLITEDEDDPGEPMMTPIINSENLVPEMKDNVITLKFEGDDHYKYANGQYDFETQILSGLSIYDPSSESWIVPGMWDDIKMPLIFTALCQIDGVTNIQFIFEDINKDIAIVYK